MMYVCAVLQAADVRHRNTASSILIMVLVCVQCVSCVGTESVLYVWYSSLSPSRLVSPPRE